MYNYLYREKESRIERYIAVAKVIYNSSSSSYSSSCSSWSISCFIKDDILHCEGCTPFLGHEDYVKC